MPQANRATGTTTKREHIPEIATTEDRPMNKRMENRRRNLKKLIDDNGGPKAVAEKVGYRSPSFLVQMTGPLAFEDPDNAKRISEDTARKIEAAFNMPEGALDWPEMKAPGMPRKATSSAPTATGKGVDAHAAARDAQIVQLLASVWSEDSITLPVLKFGQIAAYAISEAAETGHLPSPAALRRLVELLR